MKITILTVGSRGDVQPYIALGLGLQKAGFEIRIATNENFGDFVESYGLEFFPLTGDAHAIVQGDLGRNAIESGRNIFKLAGQFRKTLNSVVEPFLVDCWHACKDVDGVIHGLLGFFAQQIAEQRNIPSIGAFLQPTSRTREFPPVAVTGRNLGLLNWASHIAIEQLFWQLFRPIVNRWRVEDLDLPPISLRGPFSAYWRDKYPILFGFSPNVVTRPSDWGDHLQLTGYWFLNEAESWQPSDALADFLAAGEPPIVIGFGSMSDRDPTALADIILAATNRSRQRTIVLTGWSGMTFGATPSHLFVTDKVPHSWLLPWVKAIVHHGGMGTTAAGLRAGIPALVVPYFGDQYFWARRVFELGMGPEPINRKKLSAETLSTALHQLASNQSMTQRAAAIGQQIRSEDGVGAAVRHLQTFFQPKTAVQGSV